MRSTDIDSLSCTARAARLAALVQLDVCPSPREYERTKAAALWGRHFRVRKFSVLTRRIRMLNLRPHEKRPAATRDDRARTRSRRTGTRASRHHASTKNAARPARCAAASATRRSPPRLHIRFAPARALRRTRARRPARSSRDRSRRHDTRRYARRSANAVAEETSARALRMRLRRFWTVRPSKSCASAARHRSRGLVHVYPRGTMSALFRLSASFVS